MARQEALARLKHILTDLQSGRNDELNDIVSAREEVLARFQPIFSPGHLPDLSAEEFRSFLAFKNNKHWQGIHRHGRLITEDMPSLRDALLVLVDESRPIAERLRHLRPPSSEPKIKYLGRSIITPILLVRFPDKYGVLNQVVEDALKTLNLWPSFKGSSDFAAQYHQVNNLLLGLASELDVDLWTLDSLWWGVVAQQTPPDDDEGIPAPLDEEEEMAQFGLERHLHEFLFDNWSQTELGREWDLLEKDGEIIGFKYNTREVGEIDLLANPVCKFVSGKELGELQRPVAH